MEHINLELITTDKKLVESINETVTDNDILLRDTLLIWALLFNFDGTITLDELAKRYYIYLLPYWDDDGNHVLLFTGRDPIKHSQAIISNIYDDLLEDMEKRYDLNNPGMAPDTEKIDSKLANELITEQVS